ECAFIVAVEAGNPPVRNKSPVVAKALVQDRKSTRLNSSHLGISYAVFCLKKKKSHNVPRLRTMDCTHIRTEERGSYAVEVPSLQCCMLRAWTRACHWMSGRVSGCAQFRPYVFLFNAAPPTEIYTLSLHDALPISECAFIVAVEAGNPPVRNKSPVVAKALV